MCDPSAANDPNYYDTDSIDPTPELRPQTQPMPQHRHQFADVGVDGTVHGNVQYLPVSRQRLAAMQKYYTAVKDAYFAFGQTDGDSDEVLRRLFDSTPEVLGAVNSDGQAPIGAAIARRSWRAAGPLLALAEGRNPRALRRRTPPGIGDALARAVGANDPPADEAVLRRLVRQLGRRSDEDDGDGPDFGCDQRGRNALHAAAEAAGRRPDVLAVVLNELGSLLADEGAPASLRDRLTGALNARDSDGWTPLHRLANGNQAGAMRTVMELAQRHGLRPDWSSGLAGSGLTPLAVAAEAGAPEVCDLLLSNRLASLDLLDGQQRDLWLRVAPSDSVRRLLGRHSRRLTEPLSDVPEGDRQRLLDELRDRGLEASFVLGLCDRCPCLPQLPSARLCLDRLEILSGAARLTAWDVLLRLHQPDLAQTLEGAVDEEP